MQFEFNLCCEDNTASLAQDIAAALAPGDVIALEGALGVGKSAFCRAVIRALANNFDLEVPSPTFSILHSYEARLPVRHFDFYRLTNIEELDEIGLIGENVEGVDLIEWPSILPTAIGTDAIMLHMEILTNDARHCKIEATSTIGERLARSFEARQFFYDELGSDARRQHVNGDVSHRSYERIYSGDKKPIIFMNAPDTPAGPMIKENKSYAQLVHRALNNRPFLAIDKLIRDSGFSAPEVFAADDNKGFYLLEDFGDQSIVDEVFQPITERYLTTAHAIAGFHESIQQDGRQATNSRINYEIPFFDRRAFLTELELFIANYPNYLGNMLPAKAHQDWTDIWGNLYDNLADEQTGIVLRDVHSPNIMWLDDKPMLQRVGFIDFQDALWGCSSYDLGSLAFDARVDICSKLRKQITKAYFDGRKPLKNKQGFERNMSIFAAQRICKILGIFTRMATEGRTDYLIHLPRNLSYLGILLKTDALGELNQWFEEYLSNYSKLRSL